MANLNDAPAVPVATATGHLVAVTDGATMAFQRVPITALQDAIASAATALQPADIGGAAFEDADAYVRPAELQTQIAALNALISAQAARITALENGTTPPGGGGTPSAIVEAGILQAGIVL